MTSIPHYLRLKPKSITASSEERISLIEEQKDHQIRFKGTSGFNKFTKIFDEVTQLDLYRDTIQDITLEVLEKEKDNVFFTLGPSNSGKSYSIYGDGSNPGIAIYALNEIFQKIEKNFADYKILKKHFGESFLVSSNAAKVRNNGEYGLSISVFEIYNDKIRDLSLDTSKTVHQSLDIITDSKDGKTKPYKIRQIYVSNLNEAKLVLHKSIKRRAVSSTGLNEKSSRSHLFIYFNLHKVIGKMFVRTSRLTISDLAGSERTKDAKTEGKEFKEGNYTNQSLTELGRCLSLMKSKKFDRSILRTSKLTRLLLTDLYGHFNQNSIKVLLTLDPYTNLTTILHALRYIQPVSRVTITSERNSEVAHDSIQVLKLTEEIELLRSENQSLQKENQSLQKENQSLQKETQISEEKLLELEVNLRQDLNADYEQRIKELDYTHLKSIDELKTSNQESIDEKLQLLSQDYDQKISKLQDEHSLETTKLKNEYQQLLETKEFKIIALENEALNHKTHNDSSDKLMSSSIKELEQTKMLSEQSLISDITKEKRQNDELRQKVQQLELQAQAYVKSEQSRMIKISELTTELDKAKNKRKSDVIDDESSIKTKKARVEETEFDAEEEDLCKMSPIQLSSRPNSPSKTLPKSLASSPSKTIKFSVRSPSKHKAIFQSPFKASFNNRPSSKNTGADVESNIGIDFNIKSSPFHDDNPIEGPYNPNPEKLELKDPLKPQTIETNIQGPYRPSSVSKSKPKVTFESPIKSLEYPFKSKSRTSFESPGKALKDFNFDMALPSPKIKAKSPSKKKKLINRIIVDDSF